MIDVLQFIAGIIILIVAFLFAYMSSHLVSEKKLGKIIPLPWENKSGEPGKFDKQGVAKYNDGDNT